MSHPAAPSAPPAPSPAVRLGDLAVRGGPEGVEFLRRSGLVSSRALRAFAGGTLVDRNTDKCVVRLEGPGGALYLKRFREARPTHLLKRVFSQGLRSLARIEAGNIGWLRARGIATAEVVAWGATSLLGVDGASSFLAVRELAGRRDLTGGGREALEAGAAVLVAMTERGFYWPDSKPKHFLHSPEAGTAVIDLHGGRPRRSLAGKEIAKMLGRFLAGLDPERRAAARRILEARGAGIADAALRARFLRVLGRI